MIIGDLTLTIPREDLVHYKWTTLEKLSPTEPVRLKLLEIPSQALPIEGKMTFVMLSGAVVARPEGTLRSFNRHRRADAAHRLEKFGEQAGFDVYSYPSSLDDYLLCEECRFFGRPIVIKVEHEDFVSTLGTNWGRRVTASNGVPNRVGLHLRTFTSVHHLEEIPELYATIERKLIEYGAQPAFETE